MNIIAKNTELGLEHFDLFAVVSPKRGKYMEDNTKTTLSIGPDGSDC